jgi:glutathione synthase/RimK-type ligase-like ATP-grasp enzyme
MSKLLIYSTEDISEFSESIGHVWTENGGRYEVALPKSISDRIPTHDLIHLRFGVGEGSDLYQTLSNHVATHRCLCVNKVSTMISTANKIRATEIAADIMTVPKTMVWHREDALDKAIRRLTFPVVMKPQMSNGGKNIYFYETAQEFREYNEEEMTDAKWENKYWMLQEAVDFKKLVRVVYMDGRVVDAVYDDSTAKYKIRLRLGRHAKVWPQNDRNEMSEIAAKIAKKFDLDILALDLFVLRDGSFVFNEINTASNLRWLRLRSGVLHATLIANYLKKKEREARR